MENRINQFFYFSLIMMVLFGVLTAWSCGTGTEVLNTAIPEKSFSKEEVTKPHGTFTIKESGPLTMDVASSTLDNSWLWVKVVIVDEKNLAVLEHAFDLSYYHGPGWSEGNKIEDWTFKLPKGTYKLLVYGEDANKSTFSRAATNDVLHVRIMAGTVLSRYFILGLIGFMILSGLAYLRKANAAFVARSRAAREKLYS
jgi:hypothetical protein